MKTKKNKKKYVKENSFVEMELISFYDFHFDTYQQFYNEPWT